MRGMTKRELSDMAGYTYRRLHDIDSELPEGKKLFVQCDEGKFDPAVFVQNWVKYNVARESVGIEDLEVVKAKHEVVKTQKTELEVAKMRGQLVDVQDCKKLWGDIANTVMQNLIHLPSKIAPQLIMMENAEVIADIIGGEIRSILEQMSETPLPDYAFEDIPDEAGDSE